VVLGEYEIGSGPDCIDDGDEENCAAEAQFIKIKEVVTHEKYDNVNYKKGYDIALIRLETPATLFLDNQTVPVAPVCLPLEMPTTNFVTENMTVAGWGRVDNLGRRGGSHASLKDIGAYVDVLQKLTVPVIEPGICKEFWTTFDEDIQLCSGGVFGEDSCKGDSGGPLFYGSSRTKGEPWVQMGLVSHGWFECGGTVGDSVAPAVYTYVPAFMNWIVKNIMP